MADIQETLEGLKQAIIDGERNLAMKLTQEALEQGADPKEIVDHYMIPALEEVGKRFEQKKIFIPEMMIAAKSMQACLDIIRPLLPKETGQRKGTVVVGSVFGDLHDIGKNLVIMLLENSGFEVIDLGVNVPAKRFVEEARKVNADVVGISSLLTTGDPYVKETVMALRESDVGGKIKIICGGAALTEKFVISCGADAYAPDAASGVTKIKELLGLK